MNKVIHIKTKNTNNDHYLKSYYKEQFLSTEKRSIIPNSVEIILKGEPLYYPEIINRPLIELIDNDIINNIYILNIVKKLCKKELEGKIKGIIDGIEYIGIEKNDNILKIRFASGSFILWDKYYNFRYIVFDGKLSEEIKEIEFQFENLQDGVYYLQFDENINLNCNIVKNENQLTIGKLIISNNGNNFEYSDEEREVLKFKIGEEIIEEDLSSQINGSNSEFFISQPYTPNSIKLFYNGQRLSKNIDYTENIENQSIVFIDYTPFIGDKLFVEYIPIQ